jgi:hypothetical protein
MEHYGAEINDKPLRLPCGKQRIVTDGYQIPLAFCNDLAYLKCRPPTNEEVYLLPHIIMNADADWDPRSYNNIIVNLRKFYDPDIDEVHQGKFDEPGIYLHRTVATQFFQPEPEFFYVYEFLAFDDIIDDIVDAFYPAIVQDIYQVSKIVVCNSPKDYNLLRPFLCMGTRTLSRKHLLLPRNALGHEYLTHYDHIGNLVFLRAMLFRQLGWSCPERRQCIDIQDSVPLSVHRINYG